MARITFKCPKCGKVAELDKATPFGEVDIKTYSCGHSFVEKRLKIPEGRDEDWMKLRQYQQAGVEFLEKANFNVLLGDAMGIGKTIQVLYAYKCHTAELNPVLCIVKSAIKYQWAIEYQKWVSSKLEDLPYIVMDGDMPILPGFKFYIISMNLLKKKLEELKKINFKLIIVDESHHFKNSETGRSIYLKKLVSHLRDKVDTKTGDRKVSVICTSGTPILNRATEFFTTLNLIQPDTWNSEKRFRDNWCDYELNQRGGKKYTRIFPWRKAEFLEKISPYFLRREKREVLTDLPPFSREYYWIEIEDEEFKAAYNSELDLLSNYMNNGGKVEATTLFGYLTRLRRRTGLAKVKFTVEQVEDWLDVYPEEEKVVIGVHHKSVANALIPLLAKFNPILFTGADSAEKKREKIEQFKLPQHRIMVASVLAAGEGSNLQFCSTAILLERQWNAAKEEQFEGRFDRFGQQHPTLCNYYVAKGTVDEFYTDMVEDKRKICGDTLGDSFNVENDINLMRDLAERTVAHRL